MKREEISEELQKIEEKVKKLEAYYAHRIESIRKEAREELARMRQEWEEKIREREIELLREGRAKIEKEVQAYLRKAKRRRAMLAKKKIHPKHLEKVVQWFLTAIAE